MQIVKDTISLAILREMAVKAFGESVKAVVDIEKEIMVVDAGLHSDEECLLIAEGSKQTNVWGIGLYPSRYKALDWIEFASMINVRPSWGNNSCNVDDVKIQARIRNIVTKLVTP